MMEFERESEIMDIKEETIADTMDDVLGEGDEEEVSYWKILLLLLSGGKIKKKINAQQPCLPILKIVLHFVYLNFKYMYIPFPNVTLVFLIRKPKWLFHKSLMSLVYH